MMRLRLVILGAGVVAFLGSPPAIGAGTWGALDPNVSLVNGVPLSVSGQSLMRIDPNAHTFSGSLTLGQSLNGSLTLGSNIGNGSLTLTGGTVYRPPGLNLNTSLSQPSNHIDPLAMISVTQSVPAANRPVVPASTALGQQVITATTASVPPSRSYSLAVSRPDFSYQAASLKYRKESSSTTGQTGLAIAPGLPPGTVRYVPVGEF